MFELQNSGENRRKRGEVLKIYQGHKDLIYLREERSRVEGGGGGGFELGDEKKEIMTRREGKAEKERRLETEERGDRRLEQGEWAEYRGENGEERYILYEKCEKSRVGGGGVKEGIQGEGEKGERK